MKGKPGWEKKSCAKVITDIVATKLHSNKTKNKPDLRVNAQHLITPVQSITLWKTQKTKIKLYARLPRTAKKNLQKYAKTMKVRHKKKKNIRKGITR